ncbi:nuclear pore complex protein Nup153 isoform B [Alligator mississippiensis]|uniref:Nuclear pore complex protein Nup153 n=1 Tax=Alligator mississippiensis TaxID=8496 RepID=A0A151N137_ALLMI|nr:nuclear pore complex protein Nup153 isoform B [Alligator mississippiensis]
MASGSGGGKIRTRRYHLGASTPYSRGKQQGIISRVTESVKNIVPGWLQKYFNKSEEEHVDTSEPRNQVENPLSYHHDYTEEDTTVIDGRVTPESTRIILEEPSTSRSALNFSDVLTRPSLHRSHLNCTMLDSTAPHCQPSTSSALGIGSSGLSLVKEIKDSTSQHDDDNISTTSGFSSRASDKDIAVSKNTVPPLWSAEAERSHSLSQHTPTSSKKPAFNLTAFGALSPSLGNTSVLKTSQLGDSPFYPGKTTYGGAAAAARQSKARITPYQMPVRRQMKAKQANVQSYGVTSSTARRILQSLEKMSSPLADAKRIPSSVSSPHCSPVDRSVLDITGFHSKRKRVESQLPPVQKLVTPKTVSLSMSRSQYFKPSLTPTAESGKARQRVDIKHKGMREKNLAIELRTEPPESNSTYPKFSSPASNGLSSGGGGGGGKMRRERGLHYISKPGQEQEVEEPVLPKISLPISTMSLPQFSFGSLAATTTVSSSSITPTQPVINKVLPASNDSSPVFRFSSPIVKSTEAEVLPPLSIGFTFSVPVVKSTEPSGSSDSPMPHLFSPGTTTLNSTSNKKKGNDEYDGPFKPAKVLKEGSVLDVLKGPGFTSLKAHSLAAEQPVTTSTVVYTRPAISSFSAEDSKCVACQSEKPGGSVPVTSSSTSSFSVPSGGFMGLDKFKKPEGSWDCDICLVQNKAEATKCVACESAKPGTKAELKGFDTAAVSSAVTDPSFTFGIQTSSSESLQTLGSTGGFKLGEQGGFKFGIASEVGSSSIVTGGFKFPKTSGDFTFGVSSSDSKSEESKKDSKSNNNNFTFGLPSGTSNPSTSAFQFGTSALGQQEKDEPTLGGFSFGTSSTASLAPAENKTGASGFGFGTKEDKDVAATPFAFKKSDEKKDESPSTKGGFSFGNVESVPAPASQFVLGRTEEKPDSVTSTVPSLVFGKKVENEETKAQPMFSFGKSEQTKEESTAKPTFSFSLAKPAEKETEQTKPTFAFGAQASTADQGAAKPTFSFLSSGSSSTAVPSTSANSTSVFGSSTSASNPPPVPTPFVFGQASNTVSNSAFGSSAESTASQSFGFSQENKPATSSSTGAAVAPFVFGSGASSNNTANPGFAFGATTTSSSTGSTSSFVFGSGSSAPAAGPAFGVSQTPAFGQSQGSSQPNAPTFGSLSSTSLFSAGSQPAAPAFGSGSSSSQAPAFGQQANQQPGFGSGTPNSGSIFQFGSNPNFNFGNSNPGVFTFGANPSAPAAPAQPSGSSGFSFNQPPTFTVGSNGKNVFSASGSSVSGRKIKTAVRRRK